MTWLPRSLRSRITAAVVLLVTVVVALAGLVIVARIDHRDRTDVDRQLAARVEKGDQDADKLRDQGDHPSGDGDDSDDYGGLLAGSQSLVRLVSGGKVIAQHGETPTAPLPVPTRDGYRTIDTDGQTWRSLTRSLSTTGERLEVLQDIDPIERRLADNTAIVAAVTLLAALATAGDQRGHGRTPTPRRHTPAGGRRPLPRAEQHAGPVARQHGLHAPFHC